LPLEGDGTKSTYFRRHPVGATGDARPIREVYFPVNALAGALPAANPVTASEQHGQEVLWFDNASDDHLYFSYPPRPDIDARIAGWAAGGEDINIRLLYKTNVTGTVYWDVAYSSGITPNNGEACPTPSTHVYVEDNVTMSVGGLTYELQESGDIAIPAGAWNIGDYIPLDISRKSSAGTDTLAAHVHLVGLVIRYTAKYL